MHMGKVKWKSLDSGFWDATRCFGTDGMPKCAVGDYATVC